MNRTDQIIHGMYCDVPYRGIITESFTEWGERFHTVSLLEPIVVYNRERNTIVIHENSNFALEQEGENYYADF